MLSTKLVETAASLEVAGSITFFQFFFSIYLILPAVLQPRCRFSLLHNYVPGIFLGVKHSRRLSYDLTAICEPIV
jgi:hypothetical protein